MAMISDEKKYRREQEIDSSSMSNFRTICMNKHSEDNEANFWRRNVFFLTIFASVSHGSSLRFYNKIKVIVRHSSW